MKKFRKNTFVFVFIVVTIITLIGCSKEKSIDPNLIGRVVNIEDGRLLVVGGLAKEEINEFMLSSAMYEEVYWVRVSNQKQFEIGDQVQIWFSKIEESYPTQTVADKIQIIDEGN